MKSDSLLQGWTRRITARTCRVGLLTLFLMVQLSAMAQSSSSEPSTSSLDYSLSADVGFYYTAVLGEIDDDGFLMEGIGPTAAVRLNLNDYDIRYMIAPLTVQYFDLYPGVANHQFTNGEFLVTSLTIGREFNIKDQLSIIPRVGVTSHSGKFNYVEFNSLYPTSKSIYMPGRILYDFGLMLSARPTKDVGVNFEMSYSGYPDYHSLNFGISIRVGKL